MKAVSSTYEQVAAKCLSIKRLTGRNLCVPGDG